MTMINSEKTRKYSELHPVQIIENEAIFAVSQPDKAQELASKKVTFQQIKEQIDYDLNIVEIGETVKPNENDPELYISIGGYKVKCTRDKETQPVVYPTNVPRMVPVVSGFLMTRGVTYRIPFNALNMTLSNLTIESNTNYFSTLKVDKIDERNGVVTLVSTNDASGSVFSSITVSDSATGIVFSLNVQHGRTIISLTNISAKATLNIIETVWRGSPPTYVNYGNLQPKITLSENIKHSVVMGVNYFNQARVAHTSYGDRIDMPVTIILHEPFSGNLEIYLNDSLQSLSASKVLAVDYKD